MDAIVLNFSSNIDKSEKKGQIILEAINDSLKFWNTDLSDIIFIYPKPRKGNDYKEQLLEIMLMNEVGMIIVIDAEWDKYPKNALFELNKMALKKTMQLSKKYDCPKKIINLFCENDDISSKASLQMMSLAQDLNFKECNYLYPVFCNLEDKNNYINPNNNFNYLDDDLKTLNDCIEIIKRHQYHYSFTNRSLSIKIGA